jgi:hypothetical protein
MDINVARRRLMAALAAIPAGKNLSDFVSIPGNCRETTVLLHAFNDAVAYFGDEYFDPDGLALAQRAMDALNVQRFSTRKGPVARQSWTPSWFGNRSAGEQQGGKTKDANSRDSSLVR